MPRFQKIYIKYDSSFSNFYRFRFENSNVALNENKNLVLFTGHSYTFILEEDIEDFFFKINDLDETNNNSSIQVLYSNNQTFLSKKDDSLNIIISPNTTISNINFNLNDNSDGNEKGIIDIKPIIKVKESSSSSLNEEINLILRYSF